MNPLIDSGGDELPTASTPITLTLPDGNAAHVKEAAAVIATELSLSRRWIRLQARSVKLVQDDSAQRLFAISVGQNAAIDWSLEGSRATRPSLWHVREPDASVIEAACDAMLDHGRSEPESRQQADHEETDDADVDANSWVGEVVSVDPDNGLMYVSTGPDVRGPVMGVFWRKIEQVTSARQRANWNLASERSMPHGNRRRFSARRPAHCGTS